MGVKIQLRNDIALNWTGYNPVLAQGEIGIETDTRKLKLGDGISNWNSLIYYQFGGALGYIQSGGYVGTAQDLKDDIDAIHTHTNKSLLDSIISNGDGDGFLSNNGTYINLNTLNGGNANTF